MKGQIRLILPMMIILVLMAVVYFTGIYRHFNFETLKDRHSILQAFVTNHYILSPFLYILLYIILTTLSIPGAVFLSLLGGFLFGQPFSTLYVVLGATIGASLLFIAARSAIRETLLKKAAPFLKKMESGFKENAVSYLLFLRFVPLFPFWLVNLAPAFFNVPLRTFIWTTSIGILPGTFVFTQAGTGLSVIFASQGEFSLAAIFNFQVKIALMALGCFTLIPIAVKKIRSCKKKS